MSRQWFCTKRERWANGMMPPSVEWYHYQWQYVYILKHHWLHNDIQCYQTDCVLQYQDFCSVGSQFIALLAMLWSASGSAFRGSSG